MFLTHLLRPAVQAPSFYILDGKERIQTAILRQVANAQQSVVADLWSEDVHMVEDALAAAERRGLSVLLVVVGACNSSIENVIVHNRSDDWPNAAERKFSLLCDGRSAIVGTFGGDLKPSALETQHPAVVELLRNALYHDIVMHHIENDFGTLLAEKYGAHYEQLIYHYFEEKGWKSQPESDPCFECVSHQSSDFRYGSSHIHG